VAARAAGDPRNPGTPTQGQKPGLFDCADHGLSSGSQGRGTATRKISNAQIFEAAVSRQSVQRRLADEFLAIFGGARPVMAHLIETGQLTMDDLQDAERALRESGKNKP
jgi:hypothetical protein